MSLLSSWLWLVIALVPLIFLEGWVHRHLQGIWLLLVRDADLALVLYSLLMLPGVLVHEASHWIVATLLGVRAGAFSVVPERLPDGTLRLGYVETEHVDPLRESLIGAAPLLAGAAVIIFVSYTRLGVDLLAAALERGDLLAMGQAIRAMTSLSNFWLWLYLVFTVSNSMLPSASDRRAWWPVLLTLAVFTALLLAFGLGPVLLQTLGSPLNSGTRALAAAFSITVGLNLILAPVLWLVESGLIRLTGMKVEYR
jgi:hypothetical protein